MIIDMIIDNITPLGGACGIDRVNTYYQLWKVYESCENMKHVEKAIISVNI